MEHKKISGGATATVIIGVLAVIAGFVLMFLYLIPYSAIVLTIGVVLILIALFSCSNAATVGLDEATALKNSAAKDNDALGDIKHENERLQTRVNELTKENLELKDSLAAANETIEASNEEPNELPVIGSAALLPKESNPKVINIIAEAKKVVDEMSPYAKKAGIVINLSASSDAINVKADPKLINIMFRNIVDNSIKYMNSTGSLVITISSIGDDLFIVLKDNGRGLDVSEATHIFELNFQGSNRVSGNGLGLTQSKAIVENYGGTIYAKTSKGQGMAIYIQLPASGSGEV